MAAEEAAGEGRYPARGPSHPRVEQFRRPGTLHRSRVPRPELAYPRLAEKVVPGEDLVGPFPRHHDLVAVLSHQFREQESGAGAARIIGVSACRMTSGKTAAMSDGLTTMSWCCVPSTADIFFWYSPSSNSLSEKRSENVCTGASVYRAMTAAVTDESRPPDR